MLYHKPLKYVLVVILLSLIAIAKSAQAQEKRIFLPAIVEGALQFQPHVTTEQSGVPENETVAQRSYQALAPDQCNPACVGLSVEVTCSHPLPPYRFRPHDIEPNNTYYYELQNLSTGQNYSGYMLYQNFGPTERYYGTQVFSNHPTGNYRARFQHIPPALPGAWSYWVYKSVGQGGAISWLFGYMFQQDHPVCT